MSAEGDAVNVQGQSGSCNHTHSARATENCEALVWEYGRLQSLVAKYPQLRQNLSRILASRIQELDERLCELVTENVARRLALVLLRLASKIGKQAKGGIQVSLSREELAQMTGATVFTISRIISRWSEQGFIKPLREAVLICDRKRLEAASNDKARLVHSSKGLTRVTEPKDESCEVCPLIWHEQSKSLTAVC